MAIVAALTYVSCNDTFDNIKDFNVKEIVYPGHFDTILAAIGFERVEIDLCQAGRIPSAQMNLGKATQTVVEFTNNGKDTTVIFPGVHSWVDITGLSQPNMYQFKVYAADEFGNRSKPVEVSASPYTQSDLDALLLPDPTVNASTTAAQVEWKTNLSSRVYDVLNWSYSYTDRDGNVYEGSGEGDQPSFFVRNVTPGTPATVYINSRIIPRLNDVPILDAVDWTYSLKVSLGTRPIIFLDEPVNNAQFNLDENPVVSWIKVDDVDNYTVKFSKDKDFIDASTFSIPVGNTDSYTLTSADVSLIASSKFYYWTVVPTNSTPDIGTQSRYCFIGRPTKDVILFTPTGGNTTQMTVESQGDGVYKIITTGTDPYIYSSNINKIINLADISADDDLTVTFEYMADRDFNFQLFFSRPNAEGGASDIFLVPASSEWREYTHNIGTKAVTLNWGTATNHRFRFDYGYEAGVTIYMRDFNVNVY
jgi:hypothetical protein